METDVCVHALVSVPYPNCLHRDDSTCKQQRQRHLVSCCVLDTRLINRQSNQRHSCALACKPMPLRHSSIVTVLLEFFGISLFSSQTWHRVLLEPLVELVDGFGDVVEGWVLGGGTVVVHLGYDVQVAELHGLTAGHRGDQPQPDQTKRTHQF